MDAKMAVTTSALNAVPVEDVEPFALAVRDVYSGALATSMLLVLAVMEL